MEAYELLGTIGEGTYGVVLKARHHETGQIVAIKKFKESDEDEQVRKTALREVRILKQLRHENVVGLIEVFRRKRKLYLVFEYVESTLLEELERRPEGLDPLDVKKIMWQLMRGIEYLHSHQVIHRDVKPENLLLSKAGILKLCDFGFARTLAGAGARYTDYVSTRWYRCPELLIGDTAYGKAVDMWALGCLMAEIANGLPLFPGESDVDQLFHIQRCLGPLTPRMLELVRRNPLFAGVKLPEVVEPETLERKLPGLDPLALDVIKSCLRYEPLQRITAVELLRHPYFAGLEDWYLPHYRAALEKDAAANVLGKRAVAAALAASFAPNANGLKGGSAHHNASTAAAAALQGTKGGAGDVAKRGVMGGGAAGSSSSISGGPSILHTTSSERSATVGVSQGPAGSPEREHGTTLRGAAHIALPASPAPAHSSDAFAAVSPMTNNSTATSPEGAYGLSAAHSPYGVLSSPVRVSGTSGATGGAGAGTAPAASPIGGYGRGAIGGAGGFASFADDLPSSSNVSRLPSSDGLLTGSVPSASSQLMAALLYDTAGATVEEAQYVGVLRGGEVFGSDSKDDLGDGGGHDDASVTTAEGSEASPRHRKLDRAPDAAITQASRRSAQRKAATAAASWLSTGSPGGVARAAAAAASVASAGTTGPAPLMSVVTPMGTRSSSPQPLDERPAQKAGSKGLAGAGRPEQVAPAARRQQAPRDAVALGGVRRPAVEQHVATASGPAGGTRSTRVGGKGAAALDWSRGSDGEGKQGEGVEQLHLQLRGHEGKDAWGEGDGDAMSGKAGQRGAAAAAAAAWGRRAGAASDSKWEPPATVSPLSHSSYYGDGAREGEGGGGGGGGVKPRASPLQQPAWAPGEGNSHESLDAALMLALAHGSEGGAAGDAMLLTRAARAGAAEEPLAASGGRVSGGTWAAGGRTRASDAHVRERDAGAAAGGGITGRSISVERGERSSVLLMRNAHPLAVQAYGLGGGGGGAVGHAHKGGGSLHSSLDGGLSASASFADERDGLRGSADDRGATVVSSSSLLHPDDSLYDALRSELASRARGDRDKLLELTAARRRSDMAATTAAPVALSGGFDARRALMLSREGRDRTMLQSRGATLVGGLDSSRDRGSGAAAAQPSVPAVSGGVTGAAVVLTAPPVPLSRLVSSHGLPTTAASGGWYGGDTAQQQQHVPRGGTGSQAYLPPGSSGGVPTHLIVGGGGLGGSAVVSASDLRRLNSGLPAPPQSALGAGANKAMGGASAAAAGSAAGATAAGSLRRGELASRAGEAPPPTASIRGGGAAAVAVPASSLSAAAASAQGGGVSLDDDLSSAATRGAALRTNLASSHGYPGHATTQPLPGGRGHAGAVTINLRGGLAAPMQQQGQAGAAAAAPKATLMGEHALAGGPSLRGGTGARAGEAPLGGGAGSYPPPSTANATTRAPLVRGGGAPYRGVR